jgi:hypothetical protein
MKGIIFTGNNSLVEEKFRIEILDKTLIEPDLLSGRSYTAVGTYSHYEMIELLTNLSSETNLSTSELLYGSSLHFFKVILASSPDFFKTQNNAFDLLESFEPYLYLQALKQHPEAELPSFETRRTGNRMIMMYYSDRKIAAFAYGLMHASINHFGENINIEITPSNDDCSPVEFKLNKID